MLRVTQSVSAQGATRYFDEALARGDYYTEQDRSIGTWGGKAALQLGLSGQVQREDFEAEMKTRVRGKDQFGRQRDTERLTGNLAYAAFVHEVSRPVDGVPDPHFHIHCYVLNATYDEAEHRWKAGFFRDLKRDAPY